MKDLAETLANKYPGIIFHVSGPNWKDRFEVNFTLPTLVPSVNFAVHVWPCFSSQDKDSYQSSGCFQIPGVSMMVDPHGNDFVLPGDPLGTIDFHVDAWIQKFLNQIPSTLLKGV
jgi:hypothetical protein